MQVEGFVTGSNRNLIGVAPKSKEVGQMGTEYAIIMANNGLCPQGGT